MNNAKFGLITVSAACVSVAIFSGCASRTGAESAASSSHRIDLASSAPSSPTSGPASSAASSPISGPASSAASSPPSEAAIHVNEHVTFYPQQPPADVLTAAQAWAVYEKQTGGTHPTVPDTLQMKYGLLTFGDTITNQPAWAFVLPNSGCVITNPNVSLPPNGCNEWTIVNAITGSLIDLTFQEK